MVSTSFQGKYRATLPATLSVCQQSALLPAQQQLPIAVVASPSTCWYRLLRRVGRQRGEVGARVQADAAALSSDIDNMSSQAKEQVQSRGEDVQGPMVKPAAANKNWVRAFARLFAVWLSVAIDLLLVVSYCI